MRSRLISEEPTAVLKVSDSYAQSSRGRDERGG